MTKYNRRRNCVTASFFWGYLLISAPAVLAAPKVAIAPAPAEGQIPLASREWRPPIVFRAAKHDAGAHQDQSGIQVGTSIFQRISDRNTNVIEGTGANVDGDRARNGVALGRHAHATGGNVALGAFSTTEADLNSVAFNPGVGKLAGEIAKGEVSLGTKDHERRITNVAAGAAPTDAVNISQLAAQNKKLNGMAGSTAAAFGGGANYDPSSGSFRNPSYQVGKKQFGDVGSAISALDGQMTKSDELKVTYSDSSLKEVRLRGDATRLTNVARGEISETSRDAVNGSQLSETRQDVQKLNAQINNINEGHGIKFFHVNGGATDKTHPLSADSVAEGAGSVAIGGSAVAKGSGAVALGSYSQANETDSVALGNLSVADRKGTVSVGAAAKGGHGPILRQITNVAAGTEDTDAVNVAQLKKAGLVDKEGHTRDAVVYDSASNHRIVSLGGAGADLPTIVTNVGAGRIAAGSTDAVNGGQLFELTGRVDTLEKRKGKSEPEKQRAAERPANNGADGGGRRIAHVDSGVQDTDAANVAQLNAAVEAGVSKAQNFTNEQLAQIRSQVDHNRKDAAGGSASAIAISSLPQAFPGESMMSVAGGAFDGQSAVALGLSTSTQKWAVKASVTANTRGSYGGGAGVGYRF
ncbi:YadA-like family protein [Paraburkholderia azotifigens]|uniref:YadA-like family protein n=1 Tax=Paraburkholderia azotifigens TaxID=2057004 RepID=UPI0031728183